MSNPCIHILIIWSSAIDKKDFIIRDLQSQFRIMRIFNMHWDEKKFFSNYRTFYAHSLKNFNLSQFTTIIKNKITHCGIGDFTLVVFEDPNPDLQERETSSGKRLVNVRVFDKKTQYRTMTGGGHKIHSSDDAWETNKDLTLLFGLCTHDFLNKYQGSSLEETTINKNCEGVGGYESITQLFYVLNNTIKYCVLRNHECLPNEYTVEGHGDIDLLVEHFNYMRYLTFAKPVFKEPYRVYHTIRIAGNDIPFDFRHIGDNYYDKPWEEKILNNRILTKNLFYTPSAEDQYYSLLYHAYIQKWEVKADYLPKLTIFAKSINEVFCPEIESVIKQLDSFLEKNRYEYIRPTDKTVVYNTLNIQSSKYAFRHGQLIKRLNVEDPNGNNYHSRVYEKKDSFVKIGTNWLLHNESVFLQKLKDIEGFPKVLSEEQDPANDETLLEITRVKGKDFNAFFSDVNHQRRKYVKSFIIECIGLLDKLSSQNVSHRDFLPGNLIISDKNKKSNVSLIDFGWATDIEKAKANRPKDLAGRYVSTKNPSDSYTLGLFLLDYWYDLPYIRIISKLLRNISYQDCRSRSVFKKKLNRISIMARIAFTPYDEWRLLCRRHLRIGWTKKSIVKKIKVL